MIRPARPIARRLALSVLALMSAACSDPVHDALVTSLGPENPAIPPGPTHRAGQPCLACHGDLGPAQQQFTIGGTLYDTEFLAPPAPGGLVQIVDQEGRTIILQANAVGNFYTSAGVFLPTYPIQMTVWTPDAKMQTQMASPSNREGSCATCHFNPPGPLSPGPAFIHYNFTYDAGAPSP